MPAAQYDKRQSSPQCTADSFDIASAINDAVANGANVINLSLGAIDPCVNGKIRIHPRGAAVANAIAHNVIVVAASGNGSPGTTAVGAPACDPGVIAVGASAYNDGNANGSGFTGATRKEYVTSYSEYGTANSLHSAGSWGIVAPGGDGAVTVMTATTSTGSRTSGRRRPGIRRTPAIATPIRSAERTTAASRSTARRCPRRTSRAPQR